MWKMKKVEVIPVVVGTLGTIRNRTQSWLKRIGVEVSGNYAENRITRDN